jgi:hypothetical protein
MQTDGLRSRPTCAFYKRATWKHIRCVYAGPAILYSTPRLGFEMRTVLLGDISQSLWTSTFLANVKSDIEKIHLEIATGSTCGARARPRCLKHQLSRPRPDRPHAAIYPGHARYLLVVRVTSIASGRACHRSGRSSCCKQRGCVRSSSDRQFTGSTTISALSWMVKS